MAVSEVDIDIPAVSMVKSGDDDKEGVAACGLSLIPHDEEKDRILQSLSQHEYQAASEICNKACQKNNNRPPTSFDDDFMFKVQSHIKDKEFLEIHFPHPSWGAISANATENMMVSNIGEKNETYDEGGAKGSRDHVSNLSQKDDENDNDGGKNN